MTHSFNLRDYGEFFTHMVHSGSFRHAYSVDAQSFTEFMLKEYGLEVRVQANSRLWNVEMDDRNYTAFVLKWT